MKIDLLGVSDILREAADTEILPRFRALSPSDIEEKNPGDLVTTADRAAEAHLSKRLRDLIPSALIVGEENHEVTPDAIHGIASAEWAWIIDPLDGTHNFAHGKDRFAMIVALSHKGETCAGWIFDPVRNRMAIVEKDGGAEIDGERSMLAETKPISDMSGSLGAKLADRVRSDADAKMRPSPKSFVRYRCVGLEYMDLAAGALDFARYGGKLMPWDHAAGVLLHQEAGGYSAFGPSTRPYSLAGRRPADHLLLARDQASWEALLTLIG